MNLIHNSGSATADTNTKKENTHWMKCDKLESLYSCLLIAVSAPTRLDLVDCILEEPAHGQEGEASDYWTQQGANESRPKLFVLILLVGDVQEC